MKQHIERLSITQDDAAVKAILEEIYNGLFAGRISPMDVFADDYRQSTDGHELELAGFLAHLQHVQGQVRGIRIHVVDACFNGSLLADRHVAEVVYRDGRQARVEVYAMARIEAGRIARVDEVTRVIEGDAEDRALAHAIA